MWQEHFRDLVVVSKSISDAHINKWKLGSPENGFSV
jgi:hypothetical protein